MVTKKTLGVIGGLGPGATAHFMNLVTDMTDAAIDQEHVEMIVFSSPSIPDRTRHILDNTQPNPLPQMLAIGQKLASLGAEQIAIPCVTAHFFFHDLERKIPVPIVNGKKDRIILEGDVPSPMKPPSGCPFHPRCSKCMEICSQEKPALVEKADGHFVACHLYDNQ